MRSHIDLDLVECPDCAAPAEVVDRFDLPSTSGPVAHVKVRCLHRHWFTMIDSRVGSRFGEEQDRWDRAA